MGELDLLLCLYWHTVFLAKYYISFNFLLVWTHVSTINLTVTMLVCLSWSALPSFTETSKDLQERFSPCWPVGMWSQMQVSLVVPTNLRSPSGRAELYKLNICLLTSKRQESILIAFKNISLYIYIHYLFFSEWIYII